MFSPSNLIFLYFMDFQNVTNDESTFMFNFNLKINFTYSSEGLKMFQMTNTNNPSSPTQFTF